MATLERIRSKSVLLIVIIGVALMAFIIGDFFTSSRTLFGTGTTVAKVDGHKLDIVDYQRRMEARNQMDQQSGRKSDPALTQQQVIEEMVAEALYNQEIEDLGLTVTDAELSDLMLGRGAAMLDNRVMQETNGQISSVAQLHSMITRPMDYGLTAAQIQPIRAYWQQLESDMERQLLQQKFITLFMGALPANQLDAKAIYDENAATAHVAYVKKDYISEADDKYEVTDADLNQEWAKRKNAYRLDEQVRPVSYISVAIVPSPDDIMAGQQRVENALSKLRSNEGTDAIADMTEFIVEPQHLAASAISDRAIRQFADTAAVGAAAVVNRNANAYTIVKLNGRTSEIDSVNVDFVLLADRSKLDSVMTALNNGANPADFAQAAGVEQVQDSLWLSLLAPGMSPMKNILADAPAGRFFTPDTAATAQGARLMRVNRRRPAVPVYDFAQITYTITPSDMTVNNLEADLSNYIASNSKAADFAANALGAGYQVSNASVSSSTARLNNLDNTRNAVVWALDADKGDVSPIFGGLESGRFVVVALNDIYDDYVPVRDPSVREYLTAQVRNHKKGSALAAEYAGKASDLNGYASLMGSKVDTTTVAFGQMFVPGIGMNQSELQAQAAVAAPGKLTGPVEGSQALVVFQVVDVDNSGRPYNFEESSRQYSGSRGAHVLSNMIPGILRGNKKVENNLAKFYRD